MTVRELIKTLEKIENKDLRIGFRDWDFGVKASDIDLCWSEIAKEYGFTTLCKTGETVVYFEGCGASLYDK